MSSPYMILGVPENAPIDKVKASYKSLLAQYNEIENASVRERLIREIDEAYDSIIMSSAPSRSSGNYNDSYYQDYSDIVSRINAGRIEDAETLLDGIPKNSRDAQWYYLKGRVQHSRGWLEESYKNYKKAHEKDPKNKEYKAAYQNAAKARSAVNNSNGGYRTNQNTDYDSSSSGGADIKCCNCDGCDGCDACDICEGFICLDMCCDLGPFDDCCHCDDCC
ncbi:MAG: hypothetical protein J5562_04445 [Clostridia bacterium]|nr:hypothetical protein [Clostridia bacterium]